MKEVIVCVIEIVTIEVIASKQYPICPIVAVDLDIVVLTVRKAALVDLILV